MAAFRVNIVLGVILIISAMSQVAEGSTTTPSGDDTPDDATTTPSGDDTSTTDYATTTQPADDSATTSSSPSSDTTESYNSTQAANDTSTQDGMTTTSSVNDTTSGETTASSAGDATTPPYHGNTPPTADGTVGGNISPQDDNNGATASKTTKATPADDPASTSTAPPTNSTANETTATNTTTTPLPADFTTDAGSEVTTTATTTTTTRRPLILVFPRPHFPRPKISYDRSSWIENLLNRFGVDRRAPPGIRGLIIRLRTERAQRRRPFTFSDSTNPPTAWKGETPWEKNPQATRDNIYKGETKNENLLDQNPPRNDRFVPPGLAKKVPQRQLALPSNGGTARFSFRRMPVDPQERIAFLRSMFSRRAIQNSVASRWQPTTTRRPVVVEAQLPKSLSNVFNVPPVSPRRSFYLDNYGRPNPWRTSSNDNLSNVLRNLRDRFQDLRRQYFQ